MTTYHHGDLRHQLMAHAATLAAQEGAEAVTLRELARRTGVSHSAPVHHFGTRQHLLTALATEGFTSLGSALNAHPDDIYAMGVAYVQWALAHPGHYSVMWQPRLLDDEDANLTAARAAAWQRLGEAVAPGADEGETRIRAYAAFAVVHGLASIWLSGALPVPEHPAEVTAAVTAHLHLGGQPR